MAAVCEKEGPVNRIDRRVAFGKPNAFLSVLPTLPGSDQGYQNVQSPWTFRCQGLLIHRIGNQAASIFRRFISTVFKYC